MNVLILGGTGFVGPHLVKWLIRNGHKVTLLNRGSKRTEHAVTLVADRLDREKMQSFSQRFDAVIDLSSLTREATEIAFEQFGHPDTFWLHLSSASVYSEIGPTAPTEDQLAKGNSNFGDYGKNKAEADAFLLESGHVGLCILRPPYLYGPENNLDRESFVWSRCLNDHPIILPEDGHARIQFLHVEDLVAAMGQIVSERRRASRVYNIAATDVRSLSDWVQFLIEVSGKGVPVLANTAPTSSQSEAYSFPFKNCDCFLNTDLIRSELQWSEQFSALSGFSQTLSDLRSELLGFDTPQAEKELSTHLKPRELALAQR